MNSNTTRPWSLKTKLSLLISGIFMISIWSLAFYASQILKKDIHQLLSEQQFTTATIVASQINQELNDRFSGMENVARQITPTSMSDAASLQNFLEARPVLQNMFNGGTFITQIDGTAAASVPSSLGRIGVNYMDRDHISAALKEGKATIGRPAIGKMMKKPIIVMTVPIHDAQSHVIGALAGVVDLGKANFFDKITDNRYGKTGGYLLVAPQYRLVVTATDKSRIMDPLPDAGINTLIDRNIAGFEGTTILVTPAGVEVLTSIVKIPAASWYLAVALPTAEAFAPIHKIQKHILLAAIMMTLLAGGLTWWSLRRLLAPMLDTVTALVAMVASNKQPQPLPILRQDEIGQLIGSFNDLLYSLSQQRIALKESEELFSGMFSRHSAVMLLVEPNTGAIVDASLAAEKFYEFPHETLLTMNIRDINTLPPDVTKTERSAALAEQKNHFIFPLKKASGAISIVEMHSTPITVQNTTLLFSIIHDITKRKQMEDTLSKAQERLELAMKATPDAIWDWDLLTDTIYYSPRWWTMVGYEPNELVADTSLWRRLIHPDDLEHANSVVNKAVFGGLNHYEITTRCLHKQGHYVPILTRSFIQRDSNGMAVRISGLNTDLTDRKRTEEIESGLAKQLQKLEKTESLNRMAGAIAHNFNNLLGATVGYLELAIEDLAPEGETTKYLTSALQATQRAVEISQMMLIYLGQSFVEHTDLDLSEVCRSSLPTLQGLIQKDVVLASNFPNPGPVIIANASQMQRLLQNLVLNASEAIQDKQGTITLAIMTVSAADIATLHRFPVDWQPQDELYACLMVEDTGSGIAVKDIEKLFDPFFTTKFAGRGLGLAVVSGFLRSHRGVAIVESEPDSGSVFRVYLPLSKDHLLLQPENARKTQI